MSPNFKCICLLESINRAFNPVFAGKSVVTQLQSNSNLDLQRSIARRQGTSQRSISCHFLGLLLLLLSKWTVVLRRGNWICGATPLPFMAGDGEHVRPHMRLFSARWSDLSKRPKQIKLWDIRGAAVIHYFIFTQRQTLFTQMVQEIHWCMAWLSRSQLNELIQSWQPCLHYPPFMNTEGRILSECSTGRPNPVYISNYFVSVLFKIISVCLKLLTKLWSVQQSVSSQHSQLIITDKCININLLSAVGFSRKSSCLHLNELLDVISEKIESKKEEFNWKR